MCVLSNSTGTKDTLDNIYAKYGRTDVLVADAGITCDGMTYKMTDEMFDRVIDFNFKGVFNVVRVVGLVMEKQGFGSIINISSIVG